MRRGPEVLALDAGMGTALLEAGLPAEAPPERWVVERPERVAAVHAAHRAAGAEVLLTCTFNLASTRLTGALGAKVGELAARAVALARGAGRGARVAGAVGPTGLAAAGRGPERDARYAEAFDALAAAGADLLWVESQWHLEEALGALAAARRQGLPAVVTFTFRVDRGGGMSAASGEPALACLEAAAAAGAAAVGVNCQLPGEPVADLLAAAAPRVAVPLVAKPSAGLPGAVAPSGAFARWVAELARAGARWVGGCCGAGPEHLRAAIAALAEAG